MCDTPISSKQFTGIVRTQSLGSDFAVLDLHTQLGRCKTVDIPRSAVLVLQELHHPPRVAH
jgi:hypothetical protein